MPCLHCLVEGQVQGVFYRASTQQTANRLGLNGWVKNRRDGRVELVASGEVSALQELEAWLWQGPQYAQVTNVTCKPVDCADAELTNGFIVS